MGAKLQWTDHMGQSHELMMGPELPVVTIGRMADCQIRVVETSVSRRHSQVSYQRIGNEEVYEMTDLNSSNGTFVNDQQVQRQRLNSNDMLRCGNFALRIIIMAGAPAPAPMPPGPPGPPTPGMGGVVGAMPGPPPASAPTGYGPSQGGPPAPSSGGSNAPYLDDPSIALMPEDIPGSPYGGPPGPPPPGAPPPDMGGGGGGGGGAFETFGYGDLPPGAPPSGPPGAPPSGPPGAPPSGAPSGPPSARGTYDGPPAPGGYGAAPEEDVDIPAHLTQDQLRAELARALRRNNSLARELDSMRQGSQGATYESMRRFEQEAGRYREEVEALRLESEEARTESQRSEAQIDSLSDRNNDLKEQFSKLQDTQSELRDRLREAREDLDNALYKREELQTDVERLEKDKVDLFDQLTKLKIEYNHLERAHEQVQKEHSLLEFEYKRLDENNQELERELRASLEGDHEQVDALNKLQGIVDEKEAVIDELRERLEQMKSDMADLDSDEEWMVEIENLKIENEQLRAQKETVSERLEEVRAESVKAGDMDALEDDLIEAKDEVERLRRKLRDTISQAVFESVQTESEELRHDVNRLRDELASAKEEASSGGAEELLAQIRELQNENHRIQRSLEEQSAVHSTSPGTLRAVGADGVNMDKVKKVFTSLNGMVSGWRANLEAVQIQVGDLSDLFGKLGDALEAPIKDGTREDLRTDFDEIDPEWACESMTETVQQILSDSKQIKSMLLDLRDDLA